MTRILNRRVADPGRLELAWPEDFDELVKVLGSVSA